MLFLVYVVFLAIGVEIYFKVGNLSPLFVELLYSVYLISVIILRYDFSTSTSFSLPKIYTARLGNYRRLRIELSNLHWKVFFIFNFSMIQIKKRELIFLHQSVCSFIPQLIQLFFQVSARRYCYLCRFRTFSC